MDPQTIDQLTTPMTPDEVKTVAYNVMTKLGVQTTTWRPGAVVRTLVTVVSIFVAAITTLISQIARSGFLDLATGDWLTWLAYYNFGVQRIQATFATGTVVVTNSSGGLYSFDAGDFRVTNAVTGKTYENLSAFTLSPGQTNLPVLVTATESGAASSAPGGTITKLETSLNGVTVTNPASFVGMDVETDPALRIRCRAKASSLSPNGPADAYDYFARSAKLVDGTSAAITRTKVSGTACVVNVVVATAAGTPTSDQLTAAQTSIVNNVVPIGVSVTIAGAVGVSVTPTYQAWVKASSGLTSDQWNTKFAAALVGYLSTTPIGGTVLPGSVTGYVFSEQLQSAMHAVDPDNVIHVVVSSSDTVIPSNAVPQLGTLTLTGTVNLV